MSTVRATNITDLTGTYTSTTTAIANGIAKAWVNFNGTTASPSTIRASYNVSSVTKNATGNYTVNFTTALVDTNYSIVGGVGQQSYAATPEYGTTKTTTTCSVLTPAVVSISGDNRVLADNANICLAIFR